MAITIYTNKPKTLLKKIKNTIDAKKIETWEYDKSGDFTHSPEQWKDKGWFKPYVQEGAALIFGLLGNQQQTMKTETYAVYHGRFMEMLLGHFDKDFSNITATSMPTEEDNF